MRTDLTRRHRQPEIMDAPDLPPARFIETLRGLQRVNTVTRSSRLMWPDLRAAAQRHPDRPVRVLDVACGGGDVLIALWRHADRARISVELEGCDLSPEAVRHASEAASKAGAHIKFFVHSVAVDALPDGYDMIMSTLFLHHLDESAAISFLRQAALKTRDRVVIQDLVRSRLSYWFARLGTRVLLLNDICRLDGRTSVEGAFTRAEAKELARMAGLGGAEVVPRLPFRYLIRWVRR
ncbi:MAG TPA: methyltransferase domain-containing protein [Methyloceanibacter sp.]|nr:methyltransferase domain-containing protein [Methyloceanibacter sp.]